MKYYDFEEDLIRYPDAWCYIIYSGRNTGKTYSTLKCMYENKYAFEYTYPKYIYTHSQDTTLCALAYNNELFVKGLLLNTSSQIKLAINNSDNPLVQAIYSQLNSNKELLVYYQQSGKDKQTIDSITKQIDMLDKQLVLHCSEYRQDIERNSIDWKTVQKNLSSNEVAIEYFSAPISADSTMYCALLLRHDSPCPELISLFLSDSKSLIKTPCIFMLPCTI